MATGTTRSTQPRKTQYSQLVPDSPLATIRPFLDSLGERIGFLFDFIDAGSTLSDRLRRAAQSEETQRLAEMDALGAELRQLIDRFSQVNIRFTDISVFSVLGNDQRLINEFVRWSEQYRRFFEVATQTNAYALPTNPNSLAELRSLATAVFQPTIRLRMNIEKFIFLGEVDVAATSPRLQ